MPRQFMQNDRKAQSMMEYIALLAIVVTVLVTMSTYMRRGLQGFIRITADQIGNQMDAEQKFDDSGHIHNSITITRGSTDKERRERMGTVNYIYNDRADTDTFTLLNAGFQFRPNSN